MCSTQTPARSEAITPTESPAGLWIPTTTRESFFVRQAYFLGANDPYKSLKTTLKAEINQEAWETLHSDTSRPFAKPKSGRIAVKVINHLGDEVMKVFRGVICKFIAWLKVCWKTKRRVREIGI